MNLVESIVRDVAVVAVKQARIDASVAGDFRAGLTAVVNKHGGRLVLDLSDVTFIDSSGLGAVVSALKAGGRGGAIAIAGARANVATLFKLTRMDKVFALHASVDAAVVGLGAPAAA